MSFALLVIAQTATSAPIGSPVSPVKPTAPVGSPVECNCDALQAETALDLKANKTDVITLQDKTSCISSDSTATNLIFRGCNVNVQNGLGGTYTIGSTATTNGCGNLIIGYNELLNRNSSTDRTGSHNVIVGSGNGYTSYGGIVGGYYNTISGVYSTVTGGYNSVASGYASSFTGGQGNTASVVWSSSIIGGGSNTASGQGSLVVGGTFNEASGLFSVIVGNKGGATGTTSCADYNICP